MNSIVVTGATGFIGSNLVKRIIKEKMFNVHVIVRRGSSLELLEDVLDKITVFVAEEGIDSLVNYFKEIKPICVFHLASCFIAEHRSCDVGNLIDSNLRFSTFILEAMEQSGCKYLINTGTSWQHYNNDSYNPVCLYAATKEAFENIIKYYVEACEFKVITLKLFDTYGENDRRNKLINNLKILSLSGKTIDLTEGEQLLDFTHIQDIVDGYILAYKKIIEFKKSDHEIYALSSGRQVTLRQFIKIFEDVSGYKVKVNWGKKPYRKREVMKLWSNYEILTGWNGKISLEEGLKRLVNSK